MSSTGPWASSNGGEAFRELTEDGLVDLLRAAVYGEPGPDGRCLCISSTIGEILGHPPEAFMAGPGTWPRLLHPSDRTRLRQGEARLAAENRMQIEYRVARRDGTTVWVLDDAVRRDDLLPDVLAALAADVEDVSDARECWSRWPATRPAARRSVRGCGGVHDPGLQALAEQDGAGSGVGAFPRRRGAGGSPCRRGR